MNTTPMTDPTATDATNNSQTPEPLPPEDDLDFGDVELGERQPDACSMEEGCDSCQ
jgi:hypothetical protein